MNATDDSSTQRYYVDTTGMWMLESFFDPELGALETRHKEYLAFFVNAFSNPDAQFIGVMPTAARRNNVLPSLYDLIAKGALLEEETAIGADALLETQEILDEQFKMFCSHLAHYRDDILKFVAFHTHPKVAPGFFGATERSERLPGVPDFVEQFLTDNRIRRLCLTAHSEDTLPLQQAFAIFQRGFKYSASATTNNAKYLTHPLRWSASGLGSSTN